MWAICLHSAFTFGRKVTLPRTTQNGDLPQLRTRYVAIYFLLLRKACSKWKFSRLIFEGELGARFWALRGCSSWCTRIWSAICRIWLEQSQSHDGTGSAKLSVHCLTKCFRCSYAACTQSRYCQVSSKPIVQAVFGHVKEWIHWWLVLEIWEKFSYHKLAKTLQEKDSFS